MYTSLMQRGRSLHSIEKATVVCLFKLEATTCTLKFSFLVEVENHWQREWGIACEKNRDLSGQFKPELMESTFMGYISPRKVAN